MRRKKFCICVVFCMASILLGACSSRKEFQEGSAGEAPKTKITITWWGSESRHAYMQKLLEVYTETHEGVEFETIPTDWEGYFDKLSIQAASGTMPDIVQMDYMYINTYAKNRSISDLQPFIDQGVIDTRNIDDKYLESGRVEEKMVGIPLGSTTLAVGYNSQVLQETGVEVPSDDWTWEDYINLNREISLKTGTESAQVEVGATGDVNIFNFWVRQHGEDLFNEEGTALGFEDDQITADYFQMWKNMMDEEISPDPDETSEILTRGQESSPVMKGEAGTVFEWNNYAVKMSGINEEIRMVLPPRLEGGNESGLWIKPSMFFCISEKSAVKEACAEFIDWFTNSERANDIIKGERGVPISSKIREYMKASGRLSPQEIDMFDSIERAEKVAGDLPNPEPMGITEINEAFNRVGTAVFYERMTPEEGAKEFRTEVNRILSGD